MTDLKGSLGRTLTGLGIALGLCMFSASANAAQDVTYVRAKSSNVKVRNYPDRQALSVRTLDKGDLMRVHHESVGFYEVEIPGGLAVWVYGAYLENTSEPGVLRSTGNGVNMRPNAGSTSAHMPIKRKLKRGDLVKYIDRADATKPMSEDWVKVWSPADARAWVQAVDTEAVTSVAAAATEWANFAPRIPNAPTAKPVAPVVETKNAGAPKAAPKAAPVQPQVTDEARTALVQADGLFEEARTSQAADYTPVIRAYEKVLELAPAGSTTHQLAENGMKKVQIQAGIVAERANIAAEQAKRQSELERLAQDERDRQRMKDPLMGRFLKRGWLEERKVDGEKLYFMTWNGKTVCEVIVTDGRYSLEQFSGFEIGVMGTTVRREEPSGLGTVAQVRKLNLYRIEVISGSGARR